jgi:hypothetical protein
VAAFALGMSTAFVVSDALSIHGLVRTAVVLGVALPIDAAFNHVFARYQLVEPGSRSVVPRAKVSS